MAMIKELERVVLTAPLPSATWRLVTLAPWSACTGVTKPLKLNSPLSMDTQPQ
jgi:hypothetical protein